MIRILFDYLASLYFENIKRNEINDSEINTYTKVTPLISRYKRF